MEKLLSEIKQFNSERDWDQYHSPKNLAVSICIEAAELLENFQWEDKKVSEIKKDEKIVGCVGEELADIFIYALNLADKLGIDIEKSIKKKLEINRKKYPIEKAHGSAKKYNQI